jgi:DnaJ-class molecular chaperone
LSVEKLKKCPTCLGRGICADGSKCDICEGTGEIMHGEEVLAEEPCWDSGAHS